VVYNRVVILGRPDTIIVVAPQLASFYEFVKPRQEAEYGTMMVLLERRLGERRRSRAPAQDDRRHGERRVAQSEAAEAQLSVLGFTILHRAGEQYLA
jgi:hypothetical protein